jgi:hypothetical protein
LCLPFEPYCSSDKKAKNEKYSSGDVITFFSWYHLGI